MDRSITLSEVFQEANLVIRKNANVFIGCALTYVGITLFNVLLSGSVLKSIGFGGLNENEQASAFTPLLFMLLYLFMVVAFTTLHIGWKKICLLAIDGVQVRVSDVSRGFFLVGKYFRGSALLMLILWVPLAVMSGALLFQMRLFGGSLHSLSSLSAIGLTLALFATCGWVVYAILKYSMFGYAIADSELGGAESLKRSAMVTKGHKGVVFLLGICLACAIGLLSLPLSISMIRNAMFTMGPQLFLSTLAHQNETIFSTGSALYVATVAVGSFVSFYFSMAYACAYRAMTRLRSAVWNHSQPVAEVQ